MGLGWSSSQGPRGGGWNSNAGRSVFQMEHSGDSHTAVRRLTGSEAEGGRKLEVMSIVQTH